MITKWHNTSTATLTGDTVQAQGSEDITADAINRLWSAKHPRLSADDERDLIDRAQAGDQAATLHLIAAFMPLLKGMAPDYLHARIGGEYLDDIRQQATLGLLEALATVQPGGLLRQRAPFIVRQELESIGWAHHMVSVPKRTMQRFVKILRLAEGDAWAGAEIAPAHDMTAETFWMVYKASTFEDHLTEYDPYHNARQDSPTADNHTDGVSGFEEARLHETGYDDIDNRLTYEAIRDSAGLTDQERTILHHFAAGCTDAEVGLLVGLSRSRVAHIRLDALAKLREATTEGAAA